MRQDLRLVPHLVPGLVLLAAALPCAAEVSVSLPLEGYYRAGRYMPVRVVVKGEPAGELRVSADGAVTTAIQLDGRTADLIVPLLVVREPLGPVRWSLPDGRGGTVGTKPIALGEQDRLVGFAGGDTGATAGLFAGKTVIPVSLDATNPLRGPPAACESLDAVVLDRAPPEYLARSLAAGGTAVAVRSAAQPEANLLPWRRAGEAWVLSNDPVGPRGAIVPEAYLPTYGWRPGRTPETRRQVVLIAVLFSLFFFAATLWRSRLAVIVVVGLSAAACGALAFRAGRQSPVTVAGAVVFVRHGGIFQVDQWEFIKCMAPATTGFRPTLAARPVFASVGHFERSGVRLACGPDGMPLAFTFPLTPESSMAFLTRLASPTDALPDPAARGSPLWPLVREGYLRPGWRAAGEIKWGFDEGPEVQRENWGGIVVEELAR